MVVELTIWVLWSHLVLRISSYKLKISRHPSHHCCRCGLGRRFSNDGGTTQTEFLNYTCPESGDWSPGPITLEPCVWVACIDAPLPPNNTYLTNLQVFLDCIVTLLTFCRMINEQLILHLDHYLVKYYINLH